MTWTRAVAVVTLAAVCVAVPSASAARAPTTHERTAILRAVDTFASVTIRARQIRVTTAGGWARVVEAPEAPLTDDYLLHRVGGRWAVRGVVGRDEPKDGDCAYATRAAMRDLYRIRCPGWRALHARRVGRGEKRVLASVFMTDRRTSRYVPARAHLAYACVSRVNGRWAAAVAEFPDTGIVVFFHRTRSRWRVAYIDRQGALPRRAIVLSLASCVGYSAAQYGA